MEQALFVIAFAVAISVATSYNCKVTTASTYEPLSGALMQEECACGQTGRTDVYMYCDEDECLKCYSELLELRPDFPFVRKNFLLYNRARRIADKMTDTLNSAVGTAVGETVSGVAGYIASKAIGKVTEVYTGDKIVTLSCLKMETTDFIMANACSIGMDKIVRGVFSPEDALDNEMKWMAKALMYGNGAVSVCDTLRGENWVLSMLKDLEKRETGISAKYNDMLYQQQNSVLSHKFKVLSAKGYSVPKLLAKEMALLFIERLQVEPVNVNEMLSNLQVSLKCNEFDTVSSEMKSAMKTNIWKVLKLDITDSDLNDAMTGKSMLPSIDASLVFKVKHQKTQTKKLRKNTNKE